MSRQQFAVIPGNAGFGADWLVHPAAYSVSRNENHPMGPQPQTLSWLYQFDLLDIGVAIGSRMSNPSHLTPWDSSAPRPQAGTVPVTAIVLCFNEEVNIDRCVRSLGWCDQILVVDSGSKDASVGLAQRAGAEVVSHPFEGFGSQREWAMRNAAVRNAWVLSVDADEWVSSDLAAEIARSVTDLDARGFMLRRRLVFQNHWIRYAGWYRTSWIVRLVRKDTAGWLGEISEKLVVNGLVKRLTNDLVDEDEKDLYAWLDRHNSYSTLKAEQRFGLRMEMLSSRWKRALGANPRSRIPREIAKQVLAPAIPAPGLARFLHMYVLGGGFLMGRTGLRFCMLHAMQEMHISMKMEEAAEGHQASPAISHDHETPR